MSCSLFLQYDKDNISEKVRWELRRIISDPAFTPDQVRTRQFSLHAHSCVADSSHAAVVSGLQACLLCVTGVVVVHRLHCS